MSPSPATDTLLNVLRSAGEPTMDEAGLGGYGLLLQACVLEDFPDWSPLNRIKRVKMLYPNKCTKNIGRYSVQSYQDGVPFAVPTTPPRLLLHGTPVPSPTAATMKSWWTTRLAWNAVGAVKKAAESAIGKDAVKSGEEAVMSAKKAAESLISSTLSGCVAATKKAAESELATEVAQSAEKGAEFIMSSMKKVGESALIKEVAKSGKEAAASAKNAAEVIVNGCVVAMKKVAESEFGKEAAKLEKEAAKLAEKYVEFVMNALSRCVVAAIKVAESFFSGIVSAWPP